MVFYLVFTWYLHGIYLVFAWYLLGISWYFLGIYLVFTWYILGIFFENSWYFFYWLGILLGILLGFLLGISSNIFQPCHQIFVYHINFFHKSKFSSFCDPAQSTLFYQKCFESSSGMNTMVDAKIFVHVHVPTRFITRKTQGKGQVGLQQMLQIVVTQSVALLSI